MNKLGLVVIALLTLLGPAAAQNLKSAVAAIACRQIGATRSIPSVQSPEAHRQWLREKFGIVSKKSFVAKCSVKGTYYRFLFEEEVFENPQSAAGRLKKLSELPPGEHDKSDYAVPKILAEGFVRGKKLYTVGAFALFVEAEGFVKKYRDKLAKQIR